MSLFSSIFGEKGPVEAKAVAADPSSIPADGNFPNSFEISDDGSIVTADSDDIANRYTTPGCSLDVP